ncbi:hypothetical protein ACFFQW_22175 [Umezawaea endophytica]|uniref:Uncharacterized protein n=1 Tax=Umezawaea endophytica TaxID=1654476 RepID=A0A9X2VIW8_9PSEU|nr:hypothetical protein [Umezawaea endophytica]MCS7477456.1 hypothetical protein [Umezawaea endophytica]
MTRTPLSSGSGAATAAPLATAAIGALVLVPPSRPAAPAVAGSVGALLARTGLDVEVGPSARVERGAPKPVPDLAAHRVGSVLSGGGPAPERAGTTTARPGAAPLSGWAVGRSRPADQPTGGPRNGAPPATPPARRSTTST